VIRADTVFTRIPASHLVKRAGVNPRARRYR
jgi:hypothetical protein